MREAGTSHHAAVVVVTCACCGAREDLPGEPGARVLALRRLGAERRWAEDAANGPALAYFRWCEAGATMLAPYLFGGLLVTATAVRGGPHAFVPVCAVVGAAAATWAALRIARVRLRATLAPLVWAAPGVPGRPQRCRRCGGELPAATGAFAECAYCGAANLESRAAWAAHASELRGEVRDAMAYAHATRDEVDRAGRFVARLVRTAFALGAVIGGGLGLALA
jgi:hypothetical protein